MVYKTAALVVLKKFKLKNNIVFKQKPGKKSAKSESDEKKDENSKDKEESDEETKNEEDLNSEKIDLVSEKDEQEDTNANLNDQEPETNANQIEDLAKQVEDSKITEKSEEIDESLDKSKISSNEKDCKLENDFRLEAMTSFSSPKTAGSTDTFSLQHCLSKFTSNEILQDKICCEKCTKEFNAHRKTNQNVYTKATKQYLICELPAVLTIHLKRFQQYGFRLEKSNKQVNFPLTLDMSPYTSKMCANISSKKPVLYSLYGLVEHSGKLNCGHYTAFVKQNSKTSDSRQFLGANRLCHLKKMFAQWKNLEEHSNDLNTEKLETDASSYEQVNPDDKWYYISDSRVTEMPISKVLKAQAYILFYERIQ